MGIPSPFLLGTTRDRFDQEFVPPAVMSVDLDADSLVLPTVDVTPPFANRHRSKLLEALIQCGAVRGNVIQGSLHSLSSKDGSGDVNVTMRTEALLQSSSEDEDYIVNAFGSSSDPGDSRAVTTEIRGTLLRLTFSRPLMSVFKGFREYLETGAPQAAAEHLDESGPEESPKRKKGVRATLERSFSKAKKRTLKKCEIVFPKRAFLAELAPSLHAFASSVMDTRMYSDFLERRIRYLDPEARKMVRELACFETLAMKRMKDRVVKLSILNRITTNSNAITPVQLFRPSRSFLKTGWKRVGFKIAPPQTLVLYDTDPGNYLAILSAQKSGRAMKRRGSSEADLAAKIKKAETNLIRHQKRYLLLRGVTKITIPAGEKYEHDFAFQLEGVKPVGSTDILGEDAGNTTTLLFRASSSNVRRECILRLRSKVRSEEQLQRLMREYLDEDACDILKFASTWNAGESGVEECMHFYRNHLLGLETGTIAKE